MGEIKSEVVYDGKVAVVKFTGFIDAETYLTAKEAVENVIKSGKTRIVIDLSEVTYLSSAGWGVFVGNVKNARDAGGDIKLAAMQEEVESVYQLVEFGEILACFKTVEEAIKSFA